MEATQITDKRDCDASKNGGAHPKLEVSVARYAPSEAASSVCAVRQNGEAFILNFRHPPTRHDFIQEKVEPPCGLLDSPDSATQQFSGCRRLSACRDLVIPQRLQRSALWHRSLFSACQAESAGQTSLGLANPVLEWQEPRTMRSIKLRRKFPRGKFAWPS
jgi:hypothetical protein